MAVLRALFSAIVVFAIAGWIVYSAGPGLLRDYAIQQAYEPASEAVDIRGDCDAGVFIWKFCNVTVTPPSGAAVSDLVMFFDFHGGDYSVYPVQAKGDPSRVASSLAMERYWNRVASFIGVVVFFAILGVFGPIAMLRRGG